ncbi:MAG: hypothetical protein K2Y37_16645 [Pirellulales bacterium]|nr:hypothetical protein [Pirellulales bacterium]
MTDSLFRDLTLNEESTIERLLADDFPGRDQIVEQLKGCSVRTIDENGSLEFQVVSPVKATSTKSRVPTEGEVEDSDGIVIHFLLHVVDETVKELEVYKEDNSRVKTFPSPGAIRKS